MFFTANTLQNRNVAAHWAGLWARRAQFAANERLLMRDYGATMADDEKMACNALAGLGRDFWQQVDAQIVSMMQEVDGMEIVNDLMAVQTTLSVGKTALLYNMGGDIADDVSISIDGQAPYSFDHTDYANDGDPIPMFSAGYGVNWRHAMGLQTVDVDLVLDSQQAKLRRYNEKLVSYMLDGAANIQVQNYPAQGLRNHRNTVKIDLGQGGANVDLTTATFDQLLAFFGRTGPFGQAARTSRISTYDVLWVSPEIFANLTKPYLISLGSGQAAALQGTVMSTLLPYIPAREIRESYALEGNEFLGYVRRRDLVSPLVGMTTGITPLPRPLPQTNFNFQILGAYGLKVARDEENRSGVIYGTNITAAPVGG